MACVCSLSLSLSLSFSGYLSISSLPFPSSSLNLHFPLSLSITRSSLTNLENRESKKLRSTWIWYAIPRWASNRAGPKSRLPVCCLTSSKCVRAETLRPRPAFGSGVALSPRVQKEESMRAEYRIENWERERKKLRSSERLLGPKIIFWVKHV